MHTLLTNSLICMFKMFNLKNKYKSNFWHDSVRSSTDPLLHEIEENRVF
jgi:hypothetical protein